MQTLHVSNFDEAFCMYVWTYACTDVLPANFPSFRSKYIAFPNHCQLSFHIFSRSSPSPIYGGSMFPVMNADFNFPLTSIPEHDNSNKQSVSTCTITWLGDGEPSTQLAFLPVDITVKLHELYKQSNLQLTVALLWSDNLDRTATGHF